MDILQLLKGKKPKYDWNFIFKEYRKMFNAIYEKADEETKEVMKACWNPCHMDMTLSSWVMDISLRASGKTTQWLLIGLIMNKYYGTVIQYVRQDKDGIAPKVISNLMTTIESLGYIDYITDGKYSSYKYYANRFTFCNRDGNGSITDENENEFMHSLAIWDVINIKSNYNAPTGDLIIVDEIISNKYRANEFLDLCDVYSTIARYRKECWIILLGNTLNPYNMYFQELGISREIRKMKWGERKLLLSGLVPIYVEMIEPNELQRTENNKEMNITKFRFGFDNPKLSSINGLTTWNVKQYPHIMKDMRKDSEIIRRHIVNYNGDMVRCEIRFNLQYGYYVLCSPCHTYKSDATVYTLEVKEPFEIKGIGYRKIDNKFWELYKTNRFYYSTNECGQIIEEYLNACNKLVK